MQKLAKLGINANDNTMLKLIITPKTTISNKAMLRTLSFFAPRMQFCRSIVKGEDISVQEEPYLRLSKWMSMKSLCSRR